MIFIQCVRKLDDSKTVCYMYITKLSITISGSGYTLGRQLLWFSVCFPAHQSLTEKGSSLKAKSLLLWGSFSERKQNNFESVVSSDSVSSPVPRIFSLVSLFSAWGGVTDNKYLEECYHLITCTLGSLSGHVLQVRSQHITKTSLF